MADDFKKYATLHLGMNAMALDKYIDITSNYISPTIIEERQLNVAQMDVFSRLMMDRIIFLGTQIDEYTANVIQAQLLYLDSGHLRHDAVRIERRLHDMHGYGSLYGRCAARRGSEGKTLCPATFPRDDTPADGRCAGSGVRHRNYRTGNTETQKRTLYDYRRPFGQIV